MAGALLDVSLGNGFSMQIFSQDLHLGARQGARLQLVMQFRVRDTQRVRVWTFRVQLTDVVSEAGSGEAHEHPFLSAARRAPSTEQYWFEANLSNEQTVVIGDEHRQAQIAPRPPQMVGALQWMRPLTPPQAGGGPRPPQTVETLRRDVATPARTVGAPRPPGLRPPAHLVRPGTVLRPQLPVRPVARSEAQQAISEAIAGARQRSRSAKVGSSSEYDQTRVAAELVDTGARLATGGMNAPQPRGPIPDERDHGKGRGASR
jgi:hypothetical protein